MKILLYYLIPLFYRATYLFWKLLYSLALLLFISSSSEASKAVCNGWADTRGNKSWAKGRLTPPLSPSHTHPLRANKLDGRKSVYSWALLWWVGVNGLVRRCSYLATLSLTRKGMLPNWWSGSSSLSSRCLSAIGPVRCHTSTVV